MDKFKYRIGVMGAAGRGKVLPKELLKKAKEVGMEIARQNCVLITGACMGVPQSASEGADEIGGKIIGFSPAANLKEHTEPPISYPAPLKNTQLIFTGQGKEARAVMAIKDCDGVLFIGGSSGTFVEFAVAYAMGRAMGVLEGVKGIGEKIPEMFEFLKKSKDTRSILIADSEPENLVKKVIRVLDKE